MILENVRWLHVELTSRCNASCPSCPRNDFGYGVKVEEKDLSLDRFSEVLSLLPNLETIQYCGNTGDAISALNFKESIEISLMSRIRRLQIHTNGSSKTEDWWASLARRLRNIDHEIWFALDGLEDTHSIYRQNTNYNKIVRNAVAFMKEGGQAVWQFIPFKHNEHQIKDVIRTSQSLGFKRIEIIKNARYPSRARHHKTGNPINISPWSRQSIYDRHEGESYDQYQNLNTVVKEADCMHLSYPSLYLSHDGTLSSCCYLAKTDYKKLNISADFQEKSWKEDCLIWCGSKK